MILYLEFLQELKNKQYMYLTGFKMRGKVCFDKWKSDYTTSVCRLSVLLTRESCQVTPSDQQEKRKWWKMEIKWIRRAKKTAGSATLRRKGMGHRLRGVQTAIKIDKDRIKGKGLFGAVWHSVWRRQTGSVPAALPSEAPGNHSSSLQDTVLASHPPGYSGSPVKVPWWPISARSGHPESSHVQFALTISNSTLPPPVHSTLTYRLWA